MIRYDEILAEAGYSQKAIEEVKAGKVTLHAHVSSWFSWSNQDVSLLSDLQLHYGGSLDAASDKELSVKLAFHVDAKLKNVAGLFMRFPKKKEFDDSVIGLGEFT